MPSHEADGLVVVTVERNELDTDGLFVSCDEYDVDPSTTDVTSSFWGLPSHRLWMRKAIKRET